MVEGGEAMARVRRQEMRGVQVEWVAAGVAVVVGVGVQDATGGTQLLVHAGCGRLYGHAGFCSVRGYGKAD